MSPVAELPQSDRVGSVLGGSYKIVEALGGGAMGTVYRALHMRLNREVAVKFLAPHVAQDEMVRARFAQEAEIVSSLRHPNIVEILDYDQTEEGEPYLVLEYLSGETLEEYMDRALISRENAAHIISQISDALMVAHSAGIVHRDLKPANIFLSHVEGGAFVKVLDFGISKRGKLPTGLTGSFDVMGTPSYMPPEQAVGKTAEVDHRGDQFSLAVIAYELLTGTAPFDGDNVMSILRKVVSEPPPPPSSSDPSVPRRMDDVLLRALDKDPDSRYDDVALFAQAFAEALHGQHWTRAVASIIPSHQSRVRTKKPVSSVANPMGETRTGIGGVDMGPTEAPPPPSFTTTTPEKRRAKTRESVVQHIDDARTELMLANETQALCHLHSAVIAARDDAGDEINRLLEEGARLLGSIIKQHWGSMQARVVHRGQPDSSSNRSTLTPAQVFVLSRVEVGMTLEEIVDLSPLREAETLHHLCSLLRSDLLRVA